MASKTLPAVEQVALTTFKAESSTGGYYLVNIIDGGFVRCGCKAGAWGNACRHAKAVEAHLLAVTGAERIEGLRMPTPSVRSTGRKGYRSMHAVGPARPYDGPARPYDGPADPFEGLA